MGHLARISLTVIKVRTISVEYYQNLIPSLGQHILHHRQHGTIVHIRTAGEHGLDKDCRIGLPSQEVDKRMILQLIGNEYSIISRLTECCKHATLMIEPVIMVGRSRRQQHGYALVGSIRLGGGMPESSHTLSTSHQRSGVARIAIQTKIVGSGRLAYHHDISLHAVCGMGHARMKTEIGRRLLIMC